MARCSMKRLLLAIFLLSGLFMISCSDSTGNVSNNESTGKIQLYKYILKKDINKTKWYLACATDRYCYFSFKDGRISKRSGSNNSNIVYPAEGNYSFIEDSQTRFKYKWDETGGSAIEDEILIIDDEIIVLLNGFDEKNDNHSRAAFKDISAYTEDTPFIGLGRFSNDNWAEWLVFTPSGNCYKRFKDFTKEDYYIVCGTWEKVSDNTFKIFWTNNKKDYDILRGNLLYQNVSKNPSVISIALITK